MNHTNNIQQQDKTTATNQSIINSTPIEKIRNLKQTIKKNTDLIKRREETKKKSKLLLKQTSRYSWN